MQTLKDSKDGIFSRIFSVQKSEVLILTLSLLFIFLIFASYAILRPLRDALGLEGGTEEIKWLFLATFIVCIFVSSLSMWLSSVVKRKVYVNAIFIFFGLNLLIFYIALFFIESNSKSSAFVWLARIFYVWVSVFNMFIISSAWSLLADIFDKERSLRLFGIITAGASLGSILGASSVSLLAKILAVQNFLLLSMLLLALSLVIKFFLLKEGFRILDSKNLQNLDSKNLSQKQQDYIARFNTPLKSKNIFSGFKIIIKSRFLLALTGFILLLTSISTFLYMEQARVIAELYPRGVEGAREARIAAFAKIDLVVQILSFVIQIFFTAKIAKFLGLKWLLALLGFALSVGFVTLLILHNSLGVALLPIAIVMSIRRVGEYALVKPGREMLFVPLDSESKYKVKNFLDTVVYRGGDSLSSQVESGLMKISLSATLLCGAALSLLFGLVGLYLSKKYDKNDFK